MEEKKTRYTEAQKKAAAKYLKEKEEIRIRMDKGEKAQIQTWAAARGKSVNQYILDAIKEYEKGEL